jgi:hypothetical protein
MVPVTYPTPQWVFPLIDALVLLLYNDRMEAAACTDDDI